MLRINRQIAVHLKCVRSLTGYTSGRYALRISFQSFNPKIKLQSIPVNIIEKQPAKSQNRSECDQKYYISKSFSIKSGLNVQINQVCIFKVNSPLFSQEQEEQTNITLICQLLQIDINNARIIESYRGTVKGLSIHQYLQMDFYEGSPCQIIGTLHSCVYKFQYMKNQNQSTDFKNFCQINKLKNKDQILKYLEAQSKRQYQNIVNNYNKLLNKAIKPQVIEYDIVQKQKQLKRQKSQSSLGQKIKIKSNKELQEVIETQQTQGDEEIVIQIKKKRRKIFQINESQEDLKKYEAFQNILHKYSQRIYQLWRQMINELYRERGEKFMADKAIIYRKKLSERIGQSTARFKGSWDVDVYGQQEQMRIKLAYQLRNQDKQFYKEMSVSNNHYFPIVNQNFFTSNRPIFFEQNAFKNQNSKKTAPPQYILLVMVHGLGACRLDMQKMKIQMRRYYDKRIKVYISCANESRTEGDIQAMGLRLATQLEYQFAKYQKMPQVCFLGHSMGGIIIRCALPKLTKFKDFFHSFVTLSSPHLGYIYSTSKLVDAGLWLMNTMKKTSSILQLTMQDHQNLQETFLYKLSQKPGIQWFKKMVLLASHQDLYVPYYSARIQKHEQSCTDARKQIKEGIVYTRMIDNILQNFKGQIIRLNVNFSNPQQNLDNLIGRAAHISFINNTQMVRTFVLTGPHYFF